MQQPAIGPEPEDQRSSAAPRSRARGVRIVATGIVAVLLVWFALANLQRVQIHFWLSSTTAPLIVVILISGALGAALSSLGPRLARRRRRSPDE